MQRFLWHMRKIKFNRYHFYFVIFFLLLAGQFLQPCLIIEGNGKLTAAAPWIPGTGFSVHFIHSVQKTPVQENLVVEEKGFRLESTEYQSFGVGLPFLEEEGDFRMEDGRFVMDHMDRKFDRLSLRTGVGTRLRITLWNREYPLYEMFPPGTRIDIHEVPVYQMLWRE